MQKLENIPDGTAITKKTRKDELLQQGPIEIKIGAHSRPRRPHWSCMPCIWLAYSSCLHLLRIALPVLQVRLSGVQVDVLEALRWPTTSPRSASAFMSQSGP